jgi:thioredoxin reductase/Fe-S-cluster-containing hydrogenase component 2/CRP-like cAMP-binding protein
MAEHYKVAIIGSGPGGLSAAITAAEQGLSHVLLERTNHLSDTIFKYQKGKKVMAHPMRLPLQGSMPFEEGFREGILDDWNKSAEKSGANIRLSAEVLKLTGERGAFQMTLPGNEVITADEVIMAIGLQGNLRKVPVPGADREWVQYQLDDPDAYQNERIAIIGAGDAGIENAMALSSHNEVSIINRQPDFSRAKPGNVAAIEKAIRSGQIRAYTNSAPARIDDNALILDTAEGQSIVPVDRIIARLGAVPPRKFLEGAGIKFPSDDPAAVPELSETYECNVPGLYIIGALAGFTLIKQAVNQGHEIIRRMAGDPIPPADENLLQQRFDQAFPGASVNDVLAYLRDHVPVLAGLTMLQLREVMLESTIARFNTGDTVFRRGDYTNSLWNIAEGSAHVLINEARPDMVVRIGQSEFFGEIGLISGRRRSATVVAGEPSVMVEVPRRSMRRLQSSVKAIKAELDRVAMRRIIHTALARERPISEIEDIIAGAELKRYKAFETICAEGDAVDALYIMRTGSATVSRVEGGREVALNFIAAGSLFGERGLLEENATRAATIRATVASEAVRIDAAVIRASMDRMPELRGIFEKAVQSQLDQTVHSALARAGQVKMGTDSSAITSFLVNQGVGEATNAFIIDEGLCTRCGNCESACAATHDGISRVNRDAGTRALSVLLPVACRHCENPHCMADCPVDAITRAPTGEVFINQNTCIGCANCANNCPYGVINMVDPTSGHKPHQNWLTWLLDSVGLPTPPPPPHDHNAPHATKAVKCDLCKDTGGSPACVAACPTGAAIRVAPETYMAWVRDGRGQS